jgi:Tfp pilus assembly protein PilV
MAAVAPPYILANLQSFHGRIEYSAHRMGGAASASIAGVAVIGENAWTVDERAPGYVLHASSEGATLITATSKASSTDPLNADPLANAFVVALAELTSARLTQHPGSSAWSTPAGVVFYTDSGQTAVAGVADLGASSGPSFVFADWQQVSGLAVPQRIVRLRHGVSDAAFAVDGYAITRTIAPGDDGLAARVFGQGGADFNRTTLYAVHPLAEAGFPWRLVLTAFGCFMLGVCIVAWMRRDALVSRYGLWLAQDPRDWQGIGTSIFVSADGLMYFDECVYRVGPEFYARHVLVQHSPLFLRISARGVTKAVVLARKFRPQPSRRSLTPSRARSGGFSLLEVLVATTVLTIAIVAGVLPALFVVARSNALAAAHRAALVTASNALIDEESVAAYGTAISDGTTTSTVDGQTLMVDVHPSATAGAHDIVITVSDASGAVLARVATTVGPAVPMPGSQTTPVGCGGGGTPTPAPTSTPAPTPTPPPTPAPTAEPTATPTQAPTPRPSPSPKSSPIGLPTP